MCRDCGSAVHWQGRLDAPTDEERWIGLCEHGHITGVTLGEGATPAAEPLEAFLGPPRTGAASPAWVRFFRVTSAAPWQVQWRYRGQCDFCPAVTSFSTSIGERAGRWKIDLCLNCGSTRTSLFRRDDNHCCGELSGSSWYPACLAVKKARRLLFNRLRLAPPWLTAFSSDEG